MKDRLIETGEWIELDRYSYRSNYWWFFTGLE